MTDTDRPEVIYLQLPDDNWLMGSWSHEKELDDDIRYVRGDIVDGLLKVCHELVQHYTDHVQKPNQGLLNEVDANIMILEELRDDRRSILLP